MRSAGRLADRPTGVVEPARRFLSEADRQARMAQRAKSAWWRTLGEALAAQDAEDAQRDGAPLADSRLLPSLWPWPSADTRAALRILRLFMTPDEILGVFQMAVFRSQWGIAHIATELWSLRDRDIRTSDPPPETEVKP